MSKQIVHVFNFSSDPTFRALSRLTTEIVTVSRLKYCPDFLSMKSLYPMVSAPTKFQTSFEAIALFRADSLWKSASRDGNVNILWSGGIDSTVALVALIRKRPQAATITVFCNTNSIHENPAFYYHLLKLPFIHLKTSSVISSLPDKNFITGDLGDQIFGSELIFKVNEYLGFEALHAPFEENILKLFQKHCGLTYGTYAYERFLPIVSECPFAVKTTFDFLWWWNFSQKWQCVKLRKNCFVGAQHSLNHFFDSEEMQLWSMFNHERKLGNTITSYKQAGKDFIFNYDKNDSYRVKKTKVSSMLGSKLHFVGLYEDGSQIVSIPDCIQQINSRRLVPIEI